MILIEQSDYVDASTVRLTDRRLTHIRSVHRASVGDLLRVGRVNGALGVGRITHLDADSADLTIELNESSPPPLPLTLFLALPRPKFLAKVLQTATSLGVKRIYLFNSYKVEKVYWSCEQLSPESIRESCLLGLEQARDTILPEVHQRRLFKPFVEDELPALIQGTRALVAHPGAASACPYGVATPSTPVSLAVGPEGGFIDYEVKKLNDAGFAPIHLSERILKVEAAVTALISRLT
jgi:RsmE family RNA methyltransferase